MIIPDLKRMTATVISRRGQGSEASEAPLKPEVVKDENGEMDAKHVAAQDMLMAFHEKSPQKFSEALSNFLELHRMEPPPSEE